MFHIFELDSIKTTAAQSLTVAYSESIKSNGFSRS